MKNIPENIAKQFVASLCLTIGFDMEVCACILCPVLCFPAPIPVPEP